MQNRINSQKIFMFINHLNTLESCLRSNDFKVVRVYDDKDYALKNCWLSCDTWSGEGPEPVHLLLEVEIISAKSMIVHGYCDHTEAMTYMESPLEIKWPKNVIWHLQKNFPTNENIRNLCREANAYTPETKYKKALALEKEGKVAEAIDVHRTIQRNDLYYSASRYQMGLIFLRQAKLNLHINPELSMEQSKSAISCFERVPKDFQNTALFIEAAEDKKTIASLILENRRLGQQLQQQSQPQAATYSPRFQFNNSEQLRAEPPAVTRNQQGAP